MTSSGGRIRPPLERSPGERPRMAHTQKVTRLAIPRVTISTLWHEPTALDRPKTRKPQRREHTTPALQLRPLWWCDLLECVAGFFRALLQIVPDALHALLHRTSSFIGRFLRIFAYSLGTLLRILGCGLGAFLGILGRSLGRVPRLLGDHFRIFAHSLGTLLGILGRGLGAFLGVLPCGLRGVFYFRAGGLFIRAGIRRSSFAFALRGREHLLVHIPLL